MFHVPNEHRIQQGPLGSTDNYENNGAFEFDYAGEKLFCIASNGLLWEHVSVTLSRTGCPTWDIMCYVKDMFWDEEDTVIQFHPPKSKAVNHHPLCLHLWRPIGIEVVLPDSVMI